MKKIVFTFGRFNPPTTGHLLLATKVKEEARRRGADYKIYGSNTQDAKRNPLSAVDKSRFMKKVLKDTNVIVNNKSGNPFTVLQQLSKEGYTDITMVVGADRVAEFKNGMKKYIGKKGYENISTFDVVSAGERDPDAEGIEGMSASKMRAAAAEGNFNAFKLGIPSHVSEADRLKLFKAVRKGMGVRGKIIETWFDYDEFVEFAENYNQLDEISVQTRRKMARTAKRTAKIRARKRKLKEKRRKGKKALVKKANKAAINKVRAKLIRGMKWKDVPFLQREKIDAKIKKKKKRIAAIARKMMPAMQKAEKERLVKVRARMTTNDPAKAIEGVDYNFENEVLIEDKELRARVKANDEANRRKKEPVFYLVKTKNGKKHAVVDRVAKNHTVEKEGTAKQIKGVAQKYANEPEGFEWTDSATAIGLKQKEQGAVDDTRTVQGGEHKGKPTSELSPEEKKLAKKQTKLATMQTDGEIAAIENEPKEAIRVQKIQAKEEELNKKKLKHGATEKTDFKAVDVEAGVVAEFNRMIGHPDEIGNISKDNWGMINNSATLVSWGVEEYGIQEESASSKVIRDSINPLIKELDPDGKIKWHMEHSGSGMEDLEASQHWKDHGAGDATPKSDIVLVGVNEKGERIEHGISVKAGPSQLLSPTPEEANAILTGVFGKMVSHCEGKSSKECKSLLQSESGTSKKVDKLVDLIMNQNKMRAQTGKGVGPFSWFTPGGKYRRGAGKPDWWDTYGPGSKCKYGDTKCETSWESLEGTEPKAEHWKGTPADYKQSVIDMIEGSVEYKEELNEAMNNILNESKEFTTGLIHEAMTGCIKFCGCCDADCGCSSAVPTHYLTMSQDGSNSSIRGIDEHLLTDVGKETKFGFQWKSGGQKEIRGGKKQGTGRYSGYIALRSNKKPKKDKSYTSLDDGVQPFLKHSNIFIKEDMNMKDAEASFANDLRNTDNMREQEKELKSVKGDPGKLLDVLGMKIDNIDSNKVPWQDIGPMKPSNKSTIIYIKGKKIHIPVMNFKEQEDVNEEFRMMSEREKSHKIMKGFVEQSGWDEKAKKKQQQARASEKLQGLAPGTITSAEQGGKTYSVTDSYEFKGSPVHGLGSFATRDIKAGEEISLYYLNLLESFPSYQRTDFCRWTNHSHINENFSLLENNGNFTAHALKEIKEGEELFIDYFHVLETILNKIGNGGQVINEVIRWTEGYDHIEIEPDNGDWPTLLTLFIEQGDCPNFIHESQFYEDVIMMLPKYPHQRKEHTKDLFDKTLGRDKGWELGDPPKPLELHAHPIKEDEDPVKRAKRLKAYNARPEQRARRSARTNERQKRIRNGQLAVGDGKDIDHKDGNPENNASSNISITSVKYNRGRNNNKGRTNTDTSEEHGAGDEGTKKLLKRYLKDTPYMTINDKFSKEL